MHSLAQAEDDDFADFGIDVDAGARLRQLLRHELGLEAAPMETEMQTEPPPAEASTGGAFALDHGAIQSAMKAAAVAVAPPARLREGTTVIVSGLKNAKEHNGKHGIASKFDEAKGRYVVTLCDGPSKGKIINVRPENLAESPVCFETPATCTRCCGPLTGRCRIKHPVHKREIMCSTFRGSGMQSSCVCGACGGSYELTQLDDGSEVVSGYCFEGEHTLEPLEPGDERRIDPFSKHLVAGPQLQAEIDQLAETMPELKTLTINSAGGMYDESSTVALHGTKLKLPQLEELQLIDVAFSRITLTEETTPNLRALRMQNVPDECEIEARLPKLSKFSIHYWRGEPDWINAMLRSAKRLVSFDSYKLWLHDELCFASSHLQAIDLHRADCLPALKVYAPRLRSLGLQGCFQLEKITLVDSHPDFPAARTQRQKQTKFSVNARNANLGPHAEATLRSSTRAKYDGGGGGGGHPGMPSEGMFARMFSAGMGGGM